MVAGLGVVSAMILMRGFKSPIVFGLLKVNSCLGVSVKPYLNVVVGTVEVTTGFTPDVFSLGGVGVTYSTVISGFTSPGTDLNLIRTVVWLFMSARTDLRVVDILLKFTVVVGSVIPLR